MTTSSEDDCRFVGKREILNSPRVKAAPPSVNRPIPVPSVYVDDRGEIHNLQVGRGGGGGRGGGSRINLLFSRKGVMRSGDIHENTQHDFVFKGSVEVWRLQASSTTTTTSNNSPEEGGGGSRGGDDDDNDDDDHGTTIMRITQKRIYNSYEYIRIEPFVPHVFHFLEDTVMAEWWTEPQGFYAWFYEPYRKLVQESFTRSNNPGRFRLLKEDKGGEGDQKKNDSSPTTTTTKTMLAGLFAIGLGIGYILGRKH